MDAVQGEAELERPALLSGAALGRDQPTQSAKERSAQQSLGTCMSTCSWAVLWHTSACHMYMSDHNKEM